MPTNDPNVSPMQRMTSAGIGALITSLVVTPFDVIKVRMQVQSAEIALCIKDPRNCPQCGTLSKSAASNAIKAPAKIRASIGELNVPLRTWYLMSNGLMDTPVPRQLIQDALRHSPCRERAFRNALDAFYRIGTLEGASHLYTGLSVALWMAIPATVLYFSTYDIIRNRTVSYFESKQMHTAANWAPLFCGSMARTLSASVISPLELMRTQMMARTLHRSTTMLDGMKMNIEREGFLSLWKGLRPTLWRDIPFSGIYWMGYETLKARLKQRAVGSRVSDELSSDFSTAEALEIGFVSGAMSGAFATVLTQPFDVMKTRRQSFLIGKSKHRSAIEPVQKSLTAVTRHIVKTEGLRGLYAGIGARLTRVPIACAVMISAYEVGKIWLSKM